jgi:hypothetical protein
MKTLKVALTTVVFLSLSGLEVWQQAQIRSLKVEIAIVRGEASEVALLREESERLAKAQPKPEPYVAQPALQELLRLRGEVGVLRRHAAEEAKLQTYQREDQRDVDGQELKAKLDAAKQREELLLVTLNVPEQVLKSGVADALDAENVNAYRPYFKAKQEREEIERFEDVMEAKRRLEANNAGADTLGGSSK